MIFPERFFNKIAESINPDKFNILLIGVYPNMGDVLFRNNRKLIDSKRFLISNEENDYSFLSHHWITPNYRGSKEPLKGYRDIYIDMNTNESVNNIVKSNLRETFDLVFIDSYVICHVEDIHNFYELVTGLVKNRGIILLKKHDIEIGSDLFEGNDITYYNLNERIYEEEENDEGGDVHDEDDSPFTIIGYHSSDLISMKIVIDKQI